MTNTDIVLHGEEEGQSLTFSQQYPLAVEPVFDIDLINFQVMASSYTGGETVNVKKFLSRTTALDGLEANKTIWLWGLLCYRKERILEETGEVVSKVGVVFKLGNDQEAEETYLSFEATSAINFVKRTLLPLIQRGIIGIGDWNIGLPIRVWEVPLDGGRHTFRFRLLSPKEV